MKKSPPVSARLRWVEVDLGAIAHNTGVVKSLLEPGVGLTAVVKSDAYGHGAAPVSKTVLRAGADALAVAYLDEALELWRAGVRAPLLVMGAVLPEQAPLAARHGLSVMVDNLPLLEALEKSAPRGRPVSVQVKVNLGLCRWGLSLADLPAFLRRVGKSRGVRLDGIFSHPGYMVGRRQAKVEETLQDFLRVVRPLAGAVETHVSDSALLLDFPGYQLSRVRVGNLLYGINPTARALPLKNPWQAFARIVHLETLVPGQSVGYGGEFTAAAPMGVATVPAGYSHGLTLEPASRWIHVQNGQNYWGWLRGIKCPFVGRVGMSHCLIDLSAAKTPKVGDPVQLPLRRTASSNWEKVYKH